MTQRLLTLSRFYSLLIKFSKASQQHMQSFEFPKYSSDMKNKLLYHLHREATFVLREFGTAVQLFSPHHAGTRTLTFFLSSPYASRWASERVENWRTLLVHHVHMQRIKSDVRTYDLSRKAKCCSLCAWGCNQYVNATEFQMHTPCWKASKLLILMHVGVWTNSRCGKDEWFVG